MKHCASCTYHDNILSTNCLQNNRVSMTMRASLPNNQVRQANKYGRHRRTFRRIFRCIYGPIFVTKTKDKVASARTICGKYLADVCRQGNVNIVAKAKLDGGQTHN